MRLSAVIARARKLLADRAADDPRTVRALFVASVARHLITPSDTPRLLLVLHTEETYLHHITHREE